MNKILLQVLYDIKTSREFESLMKKIFLNVFNGDFFLL